jgi:trimethylamine---corrinoid protein Co-methyltransferase
LAGANLIYGLGMIESGVTFDFGQLVLDAEIARMVKQFVAGIRVDDETLAIDDIHAVGSHGDFLALDSTLRHMREQSQPQIMDRRVREEWVELGATDAYQKSLARARTLLDTHTPLPLPDGVPERLRAVIAGAEKELAVRS